MKKHIDKHKIQSSKYFNPTTDKIVNNSLNSNSCFDIVQLTKYEEINLSKSDTTKTVLRTKDVILNPNDEQKRFLLKWMNSARLVYNYTIEYIRDELKKNKDKSDKEKNKIFTFFRLRDFIKETENKYIKHHIVNTPSHIIANSIKSVCTAYKGGFTKLKNKSIKHFRIRYKKQGKPIHLISLDQQDFSKKINGFYVSKLGIIDSGGYNIKQTNIKHGCNLTYNTRSNKFILHVLEDVEINPIAKTNLSCGVDPGNKTFLTVYNPEGHCYKLFNRDKTLEIYDMVEKRYILKQICSERNSLNQLALRKKIEYQKAKRCIRNLSKKIKRKVDEIHYKSIYFLLNKFDNIYLGKLSTQSIVSNDLSMTKVEKEYTHALSHYTFQERLKLKSDENNKKSFIVDESYTTKTCGACGDINDVGFKRVFKCSSCKTILDRDLNASRNILIKNV